MSDYVAKAREASRRWRAAQGLPPREETLSSLSSHQEGGGLLSHSALSAQSEEVRENKERGGLWSLKSLSSQSRREKGRDQENLTREDNAIKAIKATKERKTNDSLDFLSSSSATEVRPKLAETAGAVLRLAYREWFALTVREADGCRVTPATARALHQQIVKLTDEAGVLWADALFAAELRRFRWETARCGLCGGLGHAP